MKFKIIALLFILSNLNAKIVLQILPNANPAYNIIINNKTIHPINFTLFQHPKDAKNRNQTLNPRSQFQIKYAINKIKTYIIAMNYQQGFIESTVFDTPIVVNIIEQLDNIKE